MRGGVSAAEDSRQIASVPFVISDRTLMTADSLGDLPGAAHLVLHGHEDEMGLALAPIGRVCELTLPADKLPLARATALSGLRRMGLSPILVGSSTVVGARMTDAGHTAIAWMVARGVPRRQIVAVLTDFGGRAPDPVSLEVPKVLRAMPGVEILNRWLAALANEGARLREEGLARRPSDIDCLMVAGYHFPRWRGGPMNQAAVRGLMVLRHDLRLWGAEAALWRPAPLIDRLIRDGRGIADLNG